jgi:Na+/H+-dicarboxylate symporter
MRLILRLLAGILAGILLGLFSPDWPLRLLLTFKALFGQFIGFSIPLIILFFIMSGIASLGRNGGRLLGITVGLAYSSTILAGFAAVLLGLLVIPHLAGEGATAGNGGAGMAPFFVLQVPPLLPLSTALVAAFVFGIGIAATGASRLKDLVDEARGLVDWLISRLIIPLLPFYIAGIFAELAVEGSVFTTLRIFGQVLLFILLLHWSWLTVLYLISGAITGRSPLRSIITMLPAYFTALGTMSSAATIPVSLRQNKANGVRPPVANFAVPLFATIHLAGSTITLVGCAIAVMLISPDLSAPGALAMIPFVLMLGVTMVAAPGAPGGAVMTALALLQGMLGFPEAALGLMIALYMAQDSFGTACNVTGDGALSLIVDRFAREALPAAETGEIAPAPPDAGAIERPS